MFTLPIVLGCDLLRVAIDFETHTAVLSFPDGQCCDMDGAIAYVQPIDADVCRIETWSGNAADTVVSA